MGSCAVEAGSWPIFLEKKTHKREGTPRYERGTTMVGHRPVPLFARGWLKVRSWAVFSSRSDRELGTSWLLSGYISTLVFPSVKNARVVLRTLPLLLVTAHIASIKEVWAIERVSLKGDVKMVIASTG